MLRYWNWIISFLTAEASNRRSLMTSQTSPGTITLHLRQLHRKFKDLLVPRANVKLVKSHSRRLWALWTQSHCIVQPSVDLVVADALPIVYWHCHCFGEFCTRSFVSRDTRRWQMQFLDVTHLLLLVKCHVRHWIRSLTSDLDSKRGTGSLALFWTLEFCLIQSFRSFFVFYGIV